MQTQSTTAPKRRMTAALLKQRSLAYLSAALPAGWTSQPLSPAPGRRGGGRAAAADILVISPRGRCHFLFVRAPADRWWDGGPRSVAAEKISEADAEMARQLRAAGHRARAVWGERDLLRALRTWGCPLSRAVKFDAAGSGSRQTAPLPASAPRRTLHLSFCRGQADG